MEKLGLEENKGQLGNEVEKPISFELDEGERERLVEMISEGLMLELNERINNLMRARDYYKGAGSYGEDITVDKQCIDHFGLNWAEVRKQILDNTINPITLLKCPLIDTETPSVASIYNKEAFTIKPRDLLKRNTRNWMTNDFMETLDYIYASGEKYDPVTLEYMIKKLNKYLEEKDTKNPEAREYLPVIANLAKPERIQTLIEIHSDVIGDTEIPQIIDDEFEVKRRGLHN